MSIIFRHRAHLQEIMIPQQWRAGAHARSTIGRRPRH
jgi:hypothetical protein